jgi:thiol-disulfide isomerase/thioredoxin
MKKQLLASAPAVASAALIIALSLQLVQTKRANATLRGDLVSSTQHFVRGADLPGLALTNDAGKLDLRGYCTARKPLVVYLSSPRCPFCARINPEIESLATRRRDLSIIKLVVGGQPQRGPDPTPNLQVAAAVPSAVAAAFKVNVVPAVIATDTACRIRAAGAGLNASRAVLQQAAEPRG